MIILERFRRNWQDYRPTGIEWEAESTNMQLKTIESGWTGARNSFQFNVDITTLPGPIHPVYRIEIALENSVHLRAAVNVYEKSKVVELRFVRTF